MQSLVPQGAAGRAFRPGDGGAAGQRPAFLRRCDVQPAQQLRRPRQRALPRAQARPDSVDKGFSLLEWTTALVPQGAVVSGERARRAPPVGHLPTGSARDRASTPPPHTPPLAYPPPRLHRP